MANETGLSILTNMPNPSCQLIKFLPCVPDFPHPGVMFRDISPLIANPQAFQLAIDQFAELASELSFTSILAIESRGFIFGSALAFQLRKPLLLARKPNKLPLAAHSESYGLEYGQDALEIQANHINQQSRILIIDDIVATGGTLMAASALIRKTGAQVAGALTLLEIDSLGGNNRLREQDIAARSVLSV